MYSIDAVHDLLNELCDELPEEVYKYLNAGITLLPDTVYSPEARAGDLYILAQYHRDALGRYISVYYGSLTRVYGHLPPGQFKDALRRVLRHEFRHHVESLAGNRDLEREDEEFLQRYKQAQP